MKTRVALLSLFLAWTLSPMSSALAAEGASKETMQLKPVSGSQGKVSSANTFNRLLKKEKQKNSAPSDDGIHDADNEGIAATFGRL